MIHYKAVRTKEELQDAIAYCAEKNVSSPDINTKSVMIARDDETGKVVGVVGIKRMFAIEPLVTDSPYITHILGERALAVVESSDIPMVFAMVTADKEEYLQILQKYGLVITDKNMILLRKEL